MKPLALDLCCGLGGWSDGLIAEGWDVIGYDIERHDYGSGAYPGKLVLQDIRTLDGRQFRGKMSLITASPPCTEYSYMAMPWSRGKQIRNALLGNGEFPNGYKGSRTIAQLNELFNACVRIGQEAGCPIIIENVRGAQEWVGTARWAWGSFYLWGDVPALMPIPAKIRMKSKISCAPRLFQDHVATTSEEAHAFHYRMPDEGNKTVGMNWSDQTKRGQDFTRIAGKQAMEGTKLPGNNSARRWEDRDVKRLCDATKIPSENGRRTDIGNGARFTSRDCGNEGNKQFKDFHDSPIAALGSKSKARKQASAEIAKIPPALAQWIARCFKPK